MIQKCPRWKEEELILVLNLYMNHDLNWLNKASEKTAEIIDMSNILRNLDLFSDDTKSISNFRSPSSIHMKLMNFKGLDPKYGKYGLRNAGNLDHEVWEKYSDDISKLKSKASEIYTNYFLKQKNIIIEHTDENIEIKLKTCLNYLEVFNELCKEIRNDAIKLTDIDLSQKIINCMYNQLIFSNENIVPLEKLVQELNKSRIGLIKDQNVLNENSDRKIGRYVKETFQKLIDENKLSDLDIENLMDTVRSRKIFHIGHPFLKKLQENIPTKVQIKVGKYQRYWNREYKILSNKYLVCKEWYEPNRKYYNCWLRNYNDTEKVDSNEAHESRELNGHLITFSKEYGSLTIKKDLFIDILNTIKKFDQEYICIETIKLNEDLKTKILTESNNKNSYNVVSNITKYLVDISILIPFQNSKNSNYVIEDYGLMSTLINKVMNIEENVIGDALL